LSRKRGSDAKRLSHEFDYARRRFVDAQTGGDTRRLRCVDASVSIDIRLLFRDAPSGGTHEPNAVHEQHDKRALKLAIT
jgi:hypothetical protein